MSSPTAGIKTGDTYTVTVTAKSGPTAVNAVQADITYPVSRLQLINIDGGSSGFAIQAASSGKDGLIKVARASIQPLTGDQNVVTLTFKAVGAGNASVSFSDSSMLITSTENQNLAGTRTAATVIIQ